MKYKEWLVEWLENYVKPVAKTKTYAGYSMMVNKHIAPYIGEKECNEIHALDLQKLVTHLSKEGNLVTGNGLSANSINLIISIIQSSLKTATNIGYADSYVGDHIRRPKGGGKKVESFAVNEQKQIEAYVLRGKPQYIGILLSLYTGIRIGELAALEWQDIDLKSGVLTINKACHYGKDKEGTYGRITEAPKTISSVRAIPIPKQLIPILKEQKKKSRSIFVISNGEKTISIRSYQASYARMLKRLNLNHKGFHSLRHTFATRALECGMDVKTLSEILGHGSPVITLNRYVHSLEKHKKDMMNKLGDLL